MNVLKKDIYISTFVGVFTALIWTGVFIRLGTLDRLHLGSAIWGLIVLVPLIFVAGLYIGQRLSHWKSFFASFARFVIIGFLNAGIDFGFFNLLIFLTGIEKGVEIAFFKAASFGVSFVNSYLWSKHWTFQAGATPRPGSEFIRYTIVTLGGAALNIGISYGIIHFFTPAFGFSQLAWNNIALVIATVANLLWNFVGYNIIVFKDHNVYKQN